VTGILGDHFNSTIPSVLREQAAGRPHSPLVTFTTGETFTASEVWRHAREFGSAVADVGSAGDRVVVLLDNCPEFVFTFFGAISAGRIFVPLNTALRSRSITRVLDELQPAVVVAASNLLVEVLPLVIGRPCVQCIVSVGGSEQLPGVIRFEDFSGDASLAADDEPSSLAMILYTSGTTGSSKGNMVSHRGALWFAEAAAWSLDYQEKDVLHTCLPLFHANALLCTLLAGINHGAQVVIAPKFSATRFWREIAECSATVTSMLGSIGPILWRQEPTPAERNHCLRVAYIVPTPTKDYRAFERRFKVRIVATYGLTDVSILTGFPPGTSREGACGKALPDWDLQLVNERDEPVRVGEVGEMVARPRLPFISALGYWGKPQSTVDTWRNLWIHSGDLLRQDTDGWFYFVDRKKDAIRKGGENVSSFEVEEVLLSHSWVAQAAVFAVPSELAEDDVMATVVPADETLDPAILFAYCVEELPYFAIPRYINIVPSLPSTENQKIRKAELRAQGVTSSTWDAGPISRSRFERTLPHSPKT
jgi:carnitine-CoA ligase